MPKKQKKPLNKKPLKKSTLKKSTLKKPKLKDGVNIKISIDNSKNDSKNDNIKKPDNIKIPTMKTVSTKQIPQQPFVNFPSYQPTRIQQLEPKQQFNNADLTKKIDEMYQKQSQTLNEFERKLIDKFDDSTKKNTAPQNTAPSNQPGAFDTYADNEGNVVFEEKVKKDKDTWTNRNELKGNKILETNAESLGINQLIGEAMPLNIQDVVRGLPNDDRKEVESQLKTINLEENILRNYERYKDAYIEYNGNDDYVRNMFDDKGKVIPANAWSKRAGTLIGKIMKYGTREQEKEEEEKKLNERKKLKKNNKQNQTTIV